MDDPREGQRLIDKVNAAEWCAKYIAPHLNGVSSFLDVGCGPGHILSEVGRVNPIIALHGIDISHERLALARRSISPQMNASFYEADIESLPLDSDQMDCTFTRFLLEYVRDKQRAINELTRVTASGGKVILQDLDAQFLSYYPVDTEVDIEIAQMLRDLAQTGFDPNVGRRLYTYAYRAGLGNLKVNVEPYHLYHGIICDSEMQLWTLKLDIASNALCKVSGRSKASIDKLVGRYLALLQRSENFFYSVLVTVTGTKQ